MNKKNDFYSKFYNVLIAHYTPNGYIVPMEFRVHFFPRISAFTRCTKMHLKWNVSNWD